MIEGTFVENTARVKRQKASPIRVVIANPPYSALQNSENDGNKNLKYATLDERIRRTYAERSRATLLNSVYDSYVRAIRWASDRIKDRGVIGLVTNASYIDSNAMDGLRASLKDEFESIYVFNLRGNARTSGEQRKAEAGNVFGAGTRTPVAITVLVKKPTQSEKCKLHYHDIGDYLDREEKLAIIRNFASIAGIKTAKKWVPIRPNVEHDWINQRDPAYSNFLLLGEKDATSEVMFKDYSSGVKTNRDAWVYSFSPPAVEEQMKRMIDFYNSQLTLHHDAIVGAAKDKRAEIVDDVIDTDPKKISWTRELKADLARLKPAKLNKVAIRQALYRPFTKQHLYFDRQFNNCVYQIPQIFPCAGVSNLLICATGTGATKEFSCVITDVIPDLEVISKSVCFPMSLYEVAEKGRETLNFDKEDDEVIQGYRRRDAITNATLKTFMEAYGPKVGKEDIFYYVYGVLHSPEYRTRFAADLKKMLPRIPLTGEAKDFEAFSEAGRKLAHWHLNYETVEPWPVKEHCQSLELDSEEHFKVQKMTFSRPTAEQKAAGMKWDKTRVIYNSHITLSGIPLEAYDYVVNGKPAIEWVIERYQVTRDKDSGIMNDPNDWCREHGNPRYIVDLLKRVVRVSIETMKIVQALPALNERRN